MNTTTRIRLALAIVGAVSAFAAHGQNAVGPHVITEVDNVPAYVIGTPRADWDALLHHEHQVLSAKLRGLTFDANGRIVRMELPGLDVTLTYDAIANVAARYPLTIQMNGGQPVLLPGASTESLRAAFTQAITEARASASAIPEQHEKCLIMDSYNKEAEASEKDGCSIYGDMIDGMVNNLVNGGGGGGSSDEERRAICEVACDMMADTDMLLCGLMAYRGSVVGLVTAGLCATAVTVGRWQCKIRNCGPK